MQMDVFRAGERGEFKFVTNQLPPNLECIPRNVKIPVRQNGYAQQHFQKSEDDVYYLNVSMYKQLVGERNN